MKIKLNETKENLPVAFLTSFISDSWEKVGILKQDIEAIKKEFKGTKKVEEIIQTLIDTYLVCIGQLEQHLSAKDYLDIEEAEKVAEEVKENLREDVNINIEEVKIIKPEVEIEHEEKEPEPIPAINIPVEEITIPEEHVFLNDAESGSVIEEKSLADKVSEIEEACKKEDSNEKFEYFVDEFPEPVKDSTLEN